MIDFSDSRPLADFQQNASRHIRRLKKTGRPQLLTVNGNEELVVQDAAAYRRLLAQTQNITPYTYRSVQPGLFDDIVEQRLPPGEGPPAVPVPGRTSGAMAALAERQP